MSRPMYVLLAALSTFALGIHIANYAHSQSYSPWWTIVTAPLAVYWTVRAIRTPRKGPKEIS